MQQLMENAQEFDGYVLFDAPGNIKDDGLAVMLAYADAIVCPYEYETKSLVSTQTFVGVLEQLRELNPSDEGPAVSRAQQGGHTYRHRCRVEGMDGARACPGTARDRYSEGRIPHPDATRQYLRLAG
jgi:hypothetical protein